MRVNIGKDNKLVITDFSAVQAYKIAVRMEKDGIQFYADLEKNIKDKEAKKEIEFLISQEKEHLKIFQALLDKEKSVGDDSFEEDDIVDYLNSNVFAEADVKNIEHRHTAFEEAMNRERRSIAFYEAIGSFQNIVEEEKKHLAKFAALLRDKCIKSGKGCIL